MKKLRIYADTSVFGGCFDEEFAEESKILFEEIRAGGFILVVSDVLLREILDAPERVTRLVAELPPDFVEFIPASDEMEALAGAYIQAGVVGPAAQRDAEHIAAASVADVDLIISWNFRHIVHYDKIRGYHAVNLLKGYKAIPIYSPREVVERP
jgi:hypothetical protein